MTNCSNEEWDILAKQYWANRNDEQKWVHRNILFPEFLRWMKELYFSDVLDFGCGDGDLINFLQERIESANFYGFDRSKALMQIAKKKYPNLKFIEDFWERKYDLICMNMVIQDIETPTEVLLKLKRLLNCGGTIIISIPHPCFSLDESKHITTKRKICNPSGKKFIYRYKFEETEKVFWSEKCVPTYLYNRTLTTYSTLFKKTGFNIVGLSEPFPLPSSEDSSNLFQVNIDIPKFLFFCIQERK